MKNNSIFLLDSGLWKVVWSSIVLVFSQAPKLKPPNSEAESKRSERSLRPVQPSCSKYQQHKAREVHSGPNRNCVLFQAHCNVQSPQLRELAEEVLRHGKGWSSVTEAISAAAPRQPDHGGAHKLVLTDRRPPGTERSLIRWLIHTETALEGKGQVFWIWTLISHFSNCWTLQELGFQTQEARTDWARTDSHQTVPSSHS